MKNESCAKMEDALVHATDAHAHFLSHRGSRFILHTDFDFIRSGAHPHPCPGTAGMTMRVTQALLDDVKERHFEVGRQFDITRFDKIHVHSTSLRKTLHVNTQHENQPHLLHHYH